MLHKRLGLALLACLAAKANAQWEQEQKVGAAEGQEYGAFGYAVSIANDTCLVSSNPLVPSIGSNSVLVFERLGTQWVEVCRLSPPTESAASTFGNSLVVDGYAAFVGAPSDAPSGVASGSVYSLERIEGEWRVTQRLIQEDAAQGDGFGQSVSIIGDFAIVGAPADDDDGDASGSAYIFHRNEGTWSVAEKLSASDAGPHRGFGYSVSINGESAIIGAFFGDDLLAPNAAYLFERVDGTWHEVAKLSADTQSDDGFGFSVSVNGDSAMVGAYRDSQGWNRSGTVYVYSRVDGVWMESQQLRASDAFLLDYFGHGVSLSSDIAIIGSRAGQVAGRPGRAYVFERAPSGEWLEVQILIPSDFGAGNGQGFGRSVSLSGETVVLGAVADAENGTESGAAYLFRRVGGESDCPSDLNSDGQLDFYDALLFLSYFSSADLHADFVPDGQLDFFDLQAFLAAYSAGCP